MLDIKFTDVITVEALTSNLSDDTDVEHTFATFRVTAPAFAWREHRKYPGFYYTAQAGMPLAYYLPEIDGTPGQRQLLHGALVTVSEEALSAYVELTGAGIDPAVAALVLPDNVMRAYVVSCNTAALIRFLSLRPLPMAEINTVADGYEQLLAAEAPLVHRSFVSNKEGSAS